MTALPKTKCLVFRPTVVLLVLVTCTTIALSQKRGTAPPEKEEPPIPTYTVRGRVVFDDTDRPIRRSQITLIQFPTRGEQASSATDRDGRFVMDHVHSGVYFAWVNSPGIIAPFAFMNIRENGPEEAVNVKAIKEYCTEVIVNGGDVNVTIHARRGGIISGKVTYSDGEPAINAIMSIIRPNEKEPTRVFAGLSAAGLLSAHTDDRGRYRISGLPPGEYVVSAAEKNTLMKNQRAGRDIGGLDSLFGSSDALSVTYYGGGSKIADALKLQVEANSELADIDVILPDTTPHAIRGSVIAKLDRIPLPGASVTIRRKDQADWFAQTNPQVRTDEQGVWALEDVPDGAYSVRVTAPDDIPVPGVETKPADNDDDDDEPNQKKQVPTRKFVANETQITVAGGDLIVEPIELAEGASISGTIEAPAALNPDKQPYGRPVQIIWRYEGEVRAGSRNSTFAYNDNFTIEGLHEGKVYLTAALGYPGGPDQTSPAYYVKSITLNGADVMRRPITVAEGQSIKNVHIVFVEGQAKGIIRLVDAEGKPAGERRVAIVPVDEAKWSFSREILSGLTDAQGNMPVTCAPGEYLVIVASTDDLWPPSPENIRQHSQTAQRIKLNSGTNPPIMITLIP